ncbi:MAG: T9SS type A sorting domain-containing protein [Bacteroidetes bacterium]|nr:T9SS type A sorting domain-containing protein [Bacteroidota bacterium]
MKNLLTSIFIISTFTSFGQWTQMNDSLLIGGAFATNQNVFHNDSVTIIGTPNGTYNSFDLGNTWNFSNDGLSTKTLGVNAITNFNNIPFLTQYPNRILSSADNGRSFFEITTTGIPANYNATSIYHLDSILFINGFYNGGGVASYYSNNGMNWNLVPTLTHSEYLSNKLSWGVVTGTRYFMRSDRTIFNNPAIDSLGLASTTRGDKDGNTVFMTTGDNRLFKMDMALASPYWVEITLPETGASTINIFPATNALLLTLIKTSATGKFSTKLYRSTNLGGSWTELVSSGIYLNTISYFNEMDTDTLLVNDAGGNILLSTDAGLTWNQKNTGFFDYYFSNMLVMDNSLLLRVIKNNGVADGILKSIDNGAHWDISSSGLPSVTGNSYDSTVTVRYYDYLFKQGNIAFSGNQQTLYRSFDEATTWDSISIPSGVGYFIGAFGGDEDSFFIGMMQDTGVVPTTIIRYYRTNDNGNTWQHVPSIAALNFNTSTVAPLTIVGKSDTMTLVHREFITGLEQFYVYTSVNNGDTWTDISGTTFPHPYQTLDFANLVGVGQIPILQYGNTASKWMTVISTHDSTDYFTTMHDTLYAYSQATGWSQLAGIGLPAGIDIQSIAYHDTTWTIGSNFGVFSSTDDGINWATGSMLLSTDRTPTADGLYIGMNIQTLDFKLNDGFIGTTGNGCWTTAALILGVNDEKEIDNDVAIYPNPNSGLFTLELLNKKAGSDVEIYNLLGKLIYRNKLVNEKNVIDISNEAAGMYFYKILLDGKTISDGKLIVK